MESKLQLSAYKRDYDKYSVRVPLKYRIYNITDYREVMSVEFKFKTAAIYDNGEDINY